MSEEMSLQSGYDVTVEEAQKVWDTKFAVPHVTVKRGLPDLLDVGKRLGGGGVGEVHETKINGTLLALKRIYTKYLTEAVFAEVSIMRQISKKRHHHIVQLIGSYEKRHSNSFELGLVIWPVALCDLAALLHDVGILHRWCLFSGAIEEWSDRNEEDVTYAIEMLAMLDSNAMLPDRIRDSRSEYLRLYNNTLNRLQSSVGCIASAVEWLHNCHIRHKDLKPSQVLLSSSGLWLSDFGWSKDVSDLTCSSTVGGKMTTPKYLAPERALNHPCGRPEDIFSLGCIFLEIGYQVFRTDNDDIDDNNDIGDNDAPWFQPGWLFSNNIEEALSFADSMFNEYAQASFLANLVTCMLDQNPALRPSITEVVEMLATISEFRGHCCHLKTSLSSKTKREDNVTGTNKAESTNQFNLEAEESIDSQPRSFICSNGKDLDSPLSNRHHSSVYHHDSTLEDDVLSQEHNLAIAKGRKRALTEALSDHESGPLPAGRSRTNVSGSNTPYSTLAGETDVEEEGRSPPSPFPLSTEDALLRAQIRRLAHENVEKDMRLHQLEQAVMALQRR